MARNLEIDIEATKKALQETQEAIAEANKEFTQASSNLHADVGTSGASLSGQLGTLVAGNWDENNETTFRQFNLLFNAFEMSIEAFIKNSMSFQEEATVVTKDSNGTGPDSVYGNPV